MALSNLMGVLERYRGASAAAPPQNVEQDYSNVAENVPQDHLAGGLSDAFRSDQTPAFPQMLGTLFNNSNPDQRAGILNRLLSSAGPSVLSSGALGGLSSMLRGGATVTPEQAANVPAPAVQQLAEHAQQNNPSIVDQASQYYAQHPTVVKALGAGALALIMSHISRR